MYKISQNLKGQKPIPYLFSPRGTQKMLVSLKKIGLKKRWQKNSAQRDCAVILAFAGFVADNDALVNNNSNPPIRAGILLLNFASSLFFWAEIMGGVLTTNLV